MLWSGYVYTIMLQGAEDDMVRVVGTTGPVSIAYRVADDFYLYKTGVYKRYIYIYIFFFTVELISY